ncbi:hypothetical protein RB195_015600 [Necator americanus]|uniref:Uncharacterized protein n=1 Tax=Necator americanus TaxID=51031 RepID=A0ABR1E6I6_NECAM
MLHAAISKRLHLRNVQNYLPFALFSRTHKYYWQCGSKLYSDLILRIWFTAVNGYGRRFGIRRTPSDKNFKNESTYWNSLVTKREAYCRRDKE